VVTKEIVVEAQEQPKPARRKMSYEAFLAWADEDTHAEWVNGEVIVFMPPKYIHQTTLKLLLRLLGLFIDMFDLGKIQIAPFEMNLPQSNAYREPDIFFVAKENLNRLTEARLEGPADLIIEIISDSTVRNDREDKFKEYQAAGVSEYWLIDPRPDKRRADFYHLDETGLYKLFATEDDERVESQTLAGFWLRPDWIWQADTLNPLTAFFEMRGLSAEQIAQIQHMLQMGAADK